MPTWSITSDTTHSGIADTTADAWNAVYTAAADHVRAGHLTPITATVDDQPATITPADSGNREHDIEATLRVIEATRRDVVAAHRETSP
jgi:hypothetical protein